MAPSFLDLDPRSPYGQAAWQDSTKWSGHRTVHCHSNGGNIIRHRNCVRMWSWAETSCGRFIYDSCCLTARPRLKGWLCISPLEQPRPRRTDFSAEHSARSPFLPSCKGFCIFWWIIRNNAVVLIGWCVGLGGTGYCGALEDMRSGWPWNIEVG